MCGFFLRSLSRLWNCDKLLLLLLARAQPAKSYCPKKHSGCWSVRLGCSMVWQFLLHSSPKSLANPGLTLLRNIGADPRETWGSCVEISIFRYSHLFFFSFSGLRIFLHWCLQGWKRKLFRTGGVSRVWTREPRLWGSVTWSRTFVFQRELWTLCIYIITSWLKKKPKKPHKKPHKQPKIKKNKKRGLCSLRGDDFWNRSKQRALCSVVFDLAPEHCGRMKHWGKEVTHLCRWIPFSAGAVRVCLPALCLGGCCYSRVLVTL